MKRALLVSTDRYPNGDAGSVRTHAFAKMLQLLGYNPTVIGMGTTTFFEFQEEEGILYTSFRLPGSTIISRIKGRLDFHKRLQHILFQEDAQWDIIIVSLVSRKTMEILKNFAKKNKIPLLYDSVEWYSPEQFNIGRLHPSYVAMDRRNRKYVDQSMRVIAISSYLGKWFQNRGILTTRIPVIMDTQQISFEKKIDENKFVFTYAGSPGKKDYLNVIVKGFAMASEAECDFPYELQMIGITEEQLLLICDKQDVEKIRKHLRCYGRIPREQVLEHLAKTDFTVLMRSEEQRYAKAGFPTKFAESLATATPVIANATSDLAMYLKNGENGYIVPNDSSEALMQVLLQAMQISCKQRQKMQRSARQTAEKWFDYRKYADDLKMLINH